MQYGEPDYPETRLRDRRRRAGRAVQRPRATPRRAGGAGADDAVPGAGARRRPARARRRRRRRAGHRPAPPRASLSGDAASRRSCCSGCVQDVARPRAADGDALGLLRRARRAAGVDRPLRRHRLRDAAAPQRGRHPPGAGRAARPGRAHGAASTRPCSSPAASAPASVLAGAGRTRQRVAAVRPVADRRHHLRDRRGAAGRASRCSPARSRRCAPRASIRCWRCARTDGGLVQRSDEQSYTSPRVEVDRANRVVVGVGDIQRASGEAQPAGLIELCPIEAAVGEARLARPCQRLHASV